MIINSFEGEKINSDVYIHDCIFNKMEFDYNSKTIYVFLSEPDFVIVFYNVIGFFSKTCDFWGKSPHVFGWDYIPKDESKIIKELIEENKTYNYESCKLEDYKSYIESVIITTSGDKLQIACERIEIKNTADTFDGSVSSDES